MAARFVLCFFAALSEHCFAVRYCGGALDYVYGAVNSAKGRGGKVRQDDSIPY